MNDKTAKEKGNELEDAVRSIESVIIRSSPTFSEGSFEIEGNKIINHDGVRHEIDVYVSATLGKGYDVVFIFECKNWKGKVGKNEIIVFSEKIDSARAQKGFFVASQFTSDARAQAKKDQRIELLSASEINPECVELPGRFHGIQQGHTKAYVKVRAVDAEPEDDDFKKLDLGWSFTLNGQPTDLQSYFDEWANAARDRRVNCFPSGDADEGSVKLSFQEFKQFDVGEALINGKPVRSMEMEGEVEVYVCKAVIESVYEIENRGRSINVRLKLPDVEIGAEIVSIPDSP